MRIHGPVRQDERFQRASEIPIVEGVPDFPGIISVMMISPELATPLRALADFLLVRPYPHATITRSDRELIATAVSAGNDCFYCMDAHAAFAEALFARQGAEANPSRDLTARIKLGDLGDLPKKMQHLVHIALEVRESGRKLTAETIAVARDCGATNADVQLAVMISAAFCMYNRMVDGFRARTPSDPVAYVERAGQIAAFGYADQRVGVIPTAA